MSLASSDVNNSIANASSSSVPGNNQSYTISWATTAVNALTNQLLSSYRISYVPNIQPVGHRGKRLTESMINVATSVNSANLTGLNFYTNYSYAVFSVYSYHGEELLVVMGAMGFFSTGEGGKT